jgi:hypothetical protein
MPLSIEERAAAKKAYIEMRACDTARTILIFSACIYGFFILSFGISLACGMPVLDQGKFLKGWDAVRSFVSHPHVYFFLIIILAPLIGQGFTYRRLRPRYAENLKVVTELEQAHAGEIPYGLESEIQKEYSNSRGEKRALLWRVDAFLSRKPIKK